MLQSREISEATHHSWQNQYDGMTASEAKRLKEVEDQNRKLNRSDNGPELIVNALRNWSGKLGIETLHVEPRGPRKTDMLKASTAAYATNFSRWRYSRILPPLKH